MIRFRQLEVRHKSGIGMLKKNGAERQAEIGLLSLVLGWILPVCALGFDSGFRSSTMFENYNSDILVTVQC